jgi:tRNA(fMet)-specific endonuclease VapC
MSLYVLDTDILSLYERGDPVVVSAMRAAWAKLAITVITVEEQLSGWYALVRQARDAPALARAYDRLRNCIPTLAGLPILSFTEPAIARYDDLTAMRLNVRKNDLRIAAITLENKGVLVTRNERDFRRVPGLTLENWTKPPAAPNS